MKILIAAIGKKRGGPEQALIDDYLDRAGGFGRRVGISGVSLYETDAPKSLSGDALKKREGELLLKAVPDGAKVVLLDETGDAIDSEDFAALIASWRDAGVNDLAFLVGGADGHGEQTRTRADKTLSMGKMTWPHMLARAMLAEQIYRAMTILSGHPYHRS